MTSLDKQFKPLVEAIKGGKKVTFFTGAGISTSAGIPDFRSPDTGLYANLARLKLPYAEAVFDIDYFEEHPSAFYTLASELYPGQFAPTKFHYFIRLVQDKGLLKRVYTQNIDTLERIAGVEGDYLVEAHGSFAKNHCIKCSEEMETEELKRQMSDKKVNNGIPTCPSCKGYVKPDIVFFGEGLPERFFSLWEEDSEDVDVAIVAGTSLSVYPFASYPAELESRSLRVLVNNELVGDFKSGKRKSDLVFKRDCDEFAEAIAEALGWKEELDKYTKLEKETVETDGEKEKENDKEELSKKIASEIAADLDEKDEFEDAVESLDKDISKLKI